MRHALLALKILTSDDLPKQIAIVVATIAVVLALPVLAVFSMGEEVIAFLNGSPSAESAEEQGFYMGGPVEGDTYAWGNCTYWAFAMRLWAGNRIPTSWGNANTWDERAIRDGYEVNKTPAVGAIMQSDEGEWGHVAYVIEVDSISGQWKVSEMNAPVFNVVSHRTFAVSSAAYYDFIHSKKNGLAL